MDLTLPLDHAAIERILPHRFPFLLVDRITELELDKRIVGIKNVSSNERYLSPGPDGVPVLPSLPSVLPLQLLPAPALVSKNSSIVQIPVDSHMSVIARAETGSRRLRPSKA